MSALERYRHALRGRAADRPLIAPLLPLHGAREAGQPLATFLDEPRGLVEAQLRLAERLALDVVLATPHPALDALPWGAQLELTHDERVELLPTEFLPPPEQAEPALGDDPRLGAALMTATRLRERVGDDLLVVGSVLGPYSLVDAVLGTARLRRVREQCRDRRWLPRFMDAVVDDIVERTGRLMEAGCHLVVVHEPAIAMRRLTEIDFLAVAFPLLERVSRRAAPGLGLAPGERALAFLAHLRVLDFESFFLGEEDPFDAARRALGAGKAIATTIDERKLLSWPPELVESWVARLCTEAGPGFIVSAGKPALPTAVPGDVLAALAAGAARSREPAPVPVD